MKIYFAASIRGGRDDQEIYFEIIEELKKYGTVLTEHFGNSSISSQGEEYTETYIYKRDMDWVRESDLIVAEVTTPSLGVGYELGQAEAIGIPIFALYREQEGKKLSAMVKGNPYITVQNYLDSADAATLLKKYFTK